MAKDTDKDGLSDEFERKLGTDPRMKDTDLDGLTDAAELKLGTKPLVLDTDGDGFADGSEIAQHSNPLVRNAPHPYGIKDTRGNPDPDDADLDGLTADMERMIGTRDDDPDTDGDGLSDWVESIRGTDPISPFSGGNGDRTTDLQDAKADITPKAPPPAPKPTAPAKPPKRASVDPPATDAGHPGDDAPAGARPGGPGFGPDGEAVAVLGPEYGNDSGENANPAHLAFVDAVRSQVGERYRFGAEVDLDDPDPTGGFDSSELVQWAAHQAGVDLPDGSWNQYRAIQQQGGITTVERALETPGALVFGFSSDPLASPDRPARAYVAISAGNGKVLEISERTGELREVDPGNLYTHAAIAPALQPLADTDGDGMVDVDERVMGRDPFDDADSKPGWVPPPDSTDEADDPADPVDGPITHPWQVDPTLPRPAADAIDPPDSIDPSETLDPWEGQPPEPDVDPIDPTETLDPWEGPAPEPDPGPYVEPESEPEPEPAYVDDTGAGGDGSFAIDVGLGGDGSDGYADVG